MYPVTEMPVPTFVFIGFFLLDSDHQTTAVTLFISGGMIPQALTQQ